MTDEEMQGLADKCKIDHNKSDLPKYLCNRCCEQKSTYSEGDEVTVKLGNTGADSLNAGKEVWLDRAAIIYHKPIPKPVTVKRWVNVYDNGKDGVFITDHRDENEADRNHSSYRLACKEIEFTYTLGEGL